MTKTVGGSVKSVKEDSTCSRYDLWKVCVDADTHLIRRCSMISNQDRPKEGPNPAQGGKIWAGEELGPEVRSRLQY